MWLLSIYLQIQGLAFCVGMPLSWAAQPLKEAESLIKWHKDGLDLPAILELRLLVPLKGLFVLSKP